MFQQIEAFITQIAHVVPLELFLFAGSIIEEIIAPLPSLLVPTTAGSLAEASGLPVSYLFLLGLIGAFGKTIGATVVYAISRFFGDFFIGRFGKYIGVSQIEIQKLGQYFNGSMRDDLILFVLRLLPVMPSTPISVGCGVLSINLRTYIISSFFGSFIRDTFFLYLGYSGLAALSSVSGGIDTAEKVLNILIAIALGLLVVWIYWKRRKGSSEKWMDKLTHK
jgi:membrane protein DedA with SNARE-associated domain